MQFKLIVRLESSKNLQNYAAFSLFLSFPVCFLMNHLLNTRRLNAATTKIYKIVCCNRHGTLCARIIVHSFRINNILKLVFFLSRTGNFIRLRGLRKTNTPSDVIKGLHLIRARLHWHTCPLCEKPSSFFTQRRCREMNLRQTHVCTYVAYPVRE